MSDKYTVGRITHDGRDIDHGEAVSTAIGAGASVTHNGRTYRVPDGKMGVRVFADGTVEYF